MDAKLTLPPKEKSCLTSPERLAEKLCVLINQPFPLTGKTRTDGSNIRQLVGKTLLTHDAPEEALPETYEIIPHKGAPKILLEFVDTYMVTSGTSYNLQVWNRNPSAESVQILYKNGDTLQSGEVRFVLVKIDQGKEIISSIAVLTPDYIVNQFGNFGKPTVKNQLIISSFARQQILSNDDRILIHDDRDCIGTEDNLANLPKFSLHDEPSSSSLLPLSVIKKIVSDKIIGVTIESAATKNRGQMLERIFARALGYSIQDNELLAGGYPEIRNQAIEVKIQDSPTIDLGKQSPEFENTVPGCDGFTTRTMRYFIALSNPVTSKIEGAVLCSGKRLGQHFTYVSEKSYKCQRTIPMSFFEGILGYSVFNP